MAEDFVPTVQQLRDRLLALDGKGYGAYKEIKGSYCFAQCRLWVDWVQSDPFAGPSRVRLQLPGEIAQIPPGCYATRSREIALRDFLTRQFHRAVVAQTQRLGPGQGSGKSGAIAIAPVGQTILERSAVVLLPGGGVEVRFTVGLPARGRRILGRQAATLLCERLPALAAQLAYPQLDAEALTHHLDTAEDADWLRQQLAAAGLVAFVADGAVLPRESGISDRPLVGGLPFTAPETLSVQFHRPHQGPVTGMGIPQGISVIVGGGYHGKSTLLRAIVAGVYNHIPGDGREWVVTDAGAVRLRAEDGRRVASVNISPFISNLPQGQAMGQSTGQPAGQAIGQSTGQSTTAFTTDNASGSTSQATSLMEAVEVGVTALLLDEDTCATNFMIRDRCMALLIPPEHEPITPFVDRVAALYEQGISTVMVMGGSGAYFDVATVVIAMVGFVPQEVTERAKAIAQAVEPAHRKAIATGVAPIPRRLAPRPGEMRRNKIKVQGVTQLSLDRELIDLSAAQIVDAAQTRAIGYAIAQLIKASSQGSMPLAQQLSQLMTRLERDGLDSLAPDLRGDLAQFRPFELASALNRMRSLPIVPDAAPKHLSGAPSPASLDSASGSASGSASNSPQEPLS